MILSGSFLDLDADRNGFVGNAHHQWFSKDGEVRRVFSGDSGGGICSVSSVGPAFSKGSCSSDDSSSNSSLSYGIGAPRQKVSD